MLVAMEPEDKREEDEEEVEGEGEGEGDEAEAAASPAEFWRRWRIYIVPSREDARNLTCANWAGTLALVELLLIVVSIFAMPLGARPGPASVGLHVGITLTLLVVGVRGLAFGDETKRLGCLSLIAINAWGFFPTAIWIVWGYLWLDS